MRARLVFPAVVLVTFVGGAGGAATVVPGDELVYTAGGEIRIAAADGSRSRTIARGASPTWSPEGTAIAFTSARVRGNGLDIYVMNPDGSDQHRLVMHPGGGGEHPINTADDFAPAWSPMGWAIAFTTKRDGNEEIYSMDPIGHRVQRLTNAPGADRDPAWSPDGDFITFVSDRDGNEEIYTLSPRRELRRLTHDRSADRSPTWSPDGRHIAFESFRDGNWELYAVAVDGETVHRLTASPGADENPAYSPDGSQIVFTSDRSGIQGLYVMDARGGPARRLTPAAEPGDDAAWRPGTDIAVIVVEGPRSVRRGATARFAVRVLNRTSTTAQAVMVSGHVPAALRRVAVRAAGGRCAGERTIRCSFARLAPGASARVALTARARRCGLSTFSISASSGRRDREPADNRRHHHFRISC